MRVAELTIQTELESDYQLVEKQAEQRSATTGDPGQPGRKVSAA